MASEDRAPTAWLVGVCFLGVLLGTQGVTAQAQDDVSATQPQEDASAAQPQDDASAAYTPAGADTCLRCHDESSEFPVLAIFQSKHARAADPRTPFGGLQCEACHGPGGAHAARVRRGEERPPVIDFGSHAKTPVTTQNTQCLGCHSDQVTHNWAGSPHEAEGLACADCHRIHSASDAVTEKAEQPATCYKCHARVRADTFKASSHPIRYGEMACSECHQPHGSTADAQLVRATLNDTCFTCHAEKRGPYLWEHAPVAEDCRLCHRAHGSNHPAMLTKRPPLLCQQCHSEADHPSVAYTADGLPTGTPNAFLLAGSCTNCHSQVHGSNHPSGAHLSR
jgi:DmsE family decaheme c-type cytochrome